MKRKDKVFLTHVIVLSVVAVYYIVMNALGITCPIRALSAYPCPACGMSRALISLFFLDFSGYAYYNLMAIPVIFGVLVAIHFGKRKEMRVFTEVYLVVVAIINIAYYVIRLLNNTAP